MTKQEMELATKYHWRIKYPKTFAMAVRNKFLAVDLPSGLVAPEIVRPLAFAADDSEFARKKRQVEKLRTDAERSACLPTSELKNGRRRRRNRHTELYAREAAEEGDMDLKAFLVEILARLTRIESTLSAVLER